MCKRVLACFYFHCRLYFCSITLVCGDPSPGSRSQAMCLASGSGIPLRNCNGARVPMSLIPVCHQSHG